MPQFEVYVNGMHAVTVKKELTFFMPKYTLEGTDWSVDGDFWQHRYEITSRG